MNNRLIIRNGTVVNPGTGVHAVRDVAIDGESIVKPCSFADEDADQIIDAAGCFVVPGLIDHHVHVFPLAQRFGVRVETVAFSSGVTTVSDAGSAGSDDYRAYRDFIRSSPVRILPYLYIAPAGLSALPASLENVDPATYDEGALRELFEEFPNDFVGLKIRTSAEIVGELGYTPLREAIRIADKFGKSLKVHITNPPGTMEELLSFLRPGDVVSHTYMGHGDTILDNGGHVKKEVFQARKRGILFETADGKRHFSYSVCEAAFRDGFFPDMISTDLTDLNVYVRPTVFNLAHLIARYCALGMSFDEVISCMTDRPAKHLGLYGAIGCLNAGAVADIAVLRPQSMKVEFRDRPYGVEGEHWYGDVIYEPVLTIKAGKIVYRDVTL